MGTLVVIMQFLPLFAAAMLAVFALALGGLRRLPAHEYTQLVRAPAWFTVVVAGGVLALTLIALGAQPPQGEPIYIGASLVDAYTLWATAVVATVVMIAAWAPAARRSLGARPVWVNCGLLALLWVAILALQTLSLPALLLLWLALLVGVLTLWALLLRPGWRWAALEPVLVLLGAALLGTLGLLVLQRLGRGADLLSLGVSLITESPRPVTGAMLLVLLGWLVPAVYLPWRVWVRREEAAIAWLPAALLLAVVGPLLFVRLFLFAFPPLDPTLARALGIEHLFLVRGVLGWLQAWALLMLLAGAGWLVVRLLRDRAPDAEVLRPLALVAGALMLLGIIAGVQQQVGPGLVGMLWLLTGWAGLITLWPVGLAVLDALAPGEGTERGVVLGAVWAGLALLVGVPPSPIYWGLLHGWAALGALGLPRVLIVLALAVTALVAPALLLRGARTLQAAAPRPGAGWGILAPFALVLTLLLLGLLAPRLASTLTLIQHSLTQPF